MNFEIGSKEEAIALLYSERVSTRLKAARILRKMATRDDKSVLEQALSREHVPWIKRALENAIARTDAPTSSADGVSDERQCDSDTGAESGEPERKDVWETTSVLVHEVEKCIGLVRSAAQREIDNFDVSDTKTHLDSLDDLLSSIQSLRQAAAAPKFSQVDVSHIIAEVVAREAQHSSIAVERSGPQNLICVTDHGLMSLVIANGLRNAIEATEATDSKAKQVVISWGCTDDEVYISIIDEGIGLRSESKYAFEIGRTSKKRHQGMGLPIAQRAANTLSGIVDLIPRGQGGCKYELRIPYTRENG